MTDLFDTFIKLSAYLIAFAGFVFICSLTVSSIYILQCSIHSNFENNSVVQWHFDRHEIKSSSDDLAAYSVFMSGSRSMPVYYTYIMVDDYFKRITIPAGNTRIYEDSETPYLLERCATVKLPFYERSNCGHGYELHVPSGSIKEEIDYDNK